ncbi:VITF-3 45kda subunit [Western grey kangaroopox virus]|uniref:Intermediate transcription factor 3 large subunit n=1 Tax=Western grey kangaroopox virus TaxID=1566307 RepID=A0A2C9DSS8_9POXV|nr:VITF-3 45kda subunit [Western grey kangaroopox virus]ATI21061.1 VITF-3 45kda subunit [Western grey kangaroopox virus]
MEELLTYLHSIDHAYTRTIFNFHIRHSHEIPVIYEVIKHRIVDSNVFSDVIPSTYVLSEIKKFIYCDINITKHVLNHASYPEYPQQNHKVSKVSQYFDVCIADTSRDTLRTRDIFINDKSSLVSYIKTTNKKFKIDYGEIKKTITYNSGSSGYYSGRRSDEYLSTTVRTDKSKPWIKSISKRLKVDILGQAIVTRGKSSILQTIEIIYANRTCIKIFKDSTVHVILSKDKSEARCVDLIDKLFSTYRILFLVIHALTINDLFRSYVDIVDSILAAESFGEKIELIRAHNHMYGIYNFRIGMFNITYTRPIGITVFPSLLDYRSKIKFFKGRKLNIVALSSLAECRRYVEEAAAILEAMQVRSERLRTLDVVTAAVEELKDLIL